MMKEPFSSTRRTDVVSVLLKNIVNIGFKSIDRLRNLRFVLDSLLDADLT